MSSAKKYSKFFGQWIAHDKILPSRTGISGLDSPTRWKSQICDRSRLDVLLSRLTLLILKIDWRPKRGTVILLCEPSMQENNFFSKSNRAQVVCRSCQRNKSLLKIEWWPGFAWFDNRRTQIKSPYNTLIKMEHHQIRSQVAFKSTNVLLVIKYDMIWACTKPWNIIWN